jgi:predicted MFS family arabinose efflux permease
MSDDLQRSLSAVGQLLSVSALAAACAAILLFWHAERLPPRRLLAGAVATVGAFTIVTSQLGAFPPLLAAQFVAGGAATVAYTSALILLGRLYPDARARTRRQGLIIGSLGCGPLVGTPLLRVIAAGFSWRAALAAYGALALLAAVVALVALPDVPPRASSQRKLSDALSAARLPVVGPTLLAGLGVWLLWGALGAFLAGYVKHAYADGAHWIGAFWAADGVAFGLCSFGGGPLIARLGRPAHALTVALLGMLVSMVIFVWLTPTPLVSLACFFLWVGLLGLASNALLNLLYTHSVERAGSVLFLDAAIGKLGSFSGGLLGGLALYLVHDFVGWSALLTAFSLMSLAPALLVRRAVVARAAPRVSAPAPALDDIAA